jgi:hypothetical protein
MSWMQMKKRKPNKPRVWHYGTRSLKGAETLCGKTGPDNHCFSEYSQLTTDPKRVTCKNCLFIIETP